MVVEVDMHPLKPRQVDTFSAAGREQLQHAAADAADPAACTGAAAAVRRASRRRKRSTAQAAAADESGHACATSKEYRCRRLISLIRSKNPYQLSRDGVLTLPGLSGIPLGGSHRNAGDAAARSGSRCCRRLHFRITRLPLRKTGLEGLKPFGYDLFERDPSTFSPVTNVPVPVRLCARVR